MRKSNNKISQLGTKRASKNLARLANKKNAVDQHIKFLYRNISSGKMTMDLNKLADGRNAKETKYIIDVLVSMQERNS